MFFFDLLGVAFYGNKSPVLGSSQQVLNTVNGYGNVYVYRYIYIDLLVGIGHLQYLGCTCRLYQKNVVVFFQMKTKNGWSEYLCSHVELKNKSDPLSLCSQVCSKS